MYDAELYRTKEEVARWKARDPLVTFPRWLIQQGLLDEPGHRALEAEAVAAVEAAVAVAKASPAEPVADLFRDLFGEPPVEPGSAVAAAAEAQA
jgi:TPP-dependent pyruvate/acetoin dehydrogenase alpha subunit